MTIQRFTVSRDDNIYEAWPDVVLTRGGKLICVFSECNHHGDRSYTRIVFTESTDRGRTWSPKKPLSEGTKGYPYWNCARISKLNDDRLVVVCDKIYGKGESGGINYLWFADAEGENWDGPFETPVKGIVPDKLRELSTGRWISTQKTELFII
jgi:photosystem II stability/assembly factor-like uncharacterized protein